eukprot:366036-Chlamydomonas_euryale.AAC.21
MEAQGAAQWSNTNFRWAEFCGTELKLGACGCAEMCIAAQQPGDRCEHGLGEGLHLRVHQLVHRREPSGSSPSSLSGSRPAV